MAEFVSVEEAAVELDSELNYQDNVESSSVMYWKYSNAGTGVYHPMDSGRRVTMDQQCYWTKYCAHSQSQRLSDVFYQMTRLLVPEATFRSLEE